MTKVIVMSRNNRLTDKFYNFVSQETGVDIKRVQDLRAELETNGFADLAIVDWFLLSQFSNQIRTFGLTATEEKQNMPVVALHSAPQMVKPSTIRELAKEFNFLGIISSRAEYKPPRNDVQKSTLHKLIEVIDYFKDEYPDTQPDKDAVSALMAQNVDFSKKPKVS